MACDQAGITVLVPKPQTSNNKAQGLFDKRDFRCIAADDEYECPAWSTRNVALYHDRERHDPAQVLVVCVHEVFDQRAMQATSLLR